jgi:hypothetical protein
MSSHATGANGRSAITMVEESTSLVSLATSRNQRRDDPR